MSDEYADWRYRYGTDALVADNRIGPNFGKPMIHRSCSQQISTLQSQLAAALARAEAADKRTITGILQDLLDMPPDDPDHDDAIIVLYDHLLIVLERWVKYGGIEPALGGYRAALAAAAPGEGE